MSRFEERLAEGGVVVGDGGTGALLSTAVPRLCCPEEANLKAPEAVIGVHAGFIRAGADLIETNTFGANRRKLSAQYLDDRLEEILERGVKLAREARDVAGVPVLVGGAIGARVARRLNDDVLRWSVIALGVGVAVWLLLR